jgi:(p)ppGpp synthase/HD superfamily hydrolase
MSDRYTKLEIALRYYLLGAKYHTALKAMDFAKQYHTGTRKDGVTPEFSHQVEMSLYILGLKGLIDEERTVTVALLHDVVEDYEHVSIATINSMFGPEIADSCARLDKTGKNYDFYFAEIAKSASDSIVKGADRVHNVNSMKGVFSKDKQNKYIEEVEVHFLPMLKLARNRFPQQMQAYFSIMHMLRSQTNLLKDK